MHQSHKNLYLLSGSFPLFLATELQKRERGGGSEVYYFINNKNDKIIHNSDLKGLKISFVSNWFEFLYFLLKILLFKSSYRKVFAGDIGVSKISLLYKMFPLEKKFIIEDGSATLSLVRDGYFQYYSSLFSKNMLSRIKFRFLAPEWGAVYLTIFDGLNSDHFCLQHIKLDSVCSVNLSAAKNLLILSSPVVPTALMDPNTYQKILHELLRSNVMSKYSFEEIYIKTHPIEYDNFFASIVARRGNISLFNSNEPIEFIDLDKYDIKVVVGFGTTALLSLSKIYPQLKFYNIEIEDFMPPNSRQEFKVLNEYLLNKSDVLTIPVEEVAAGLHG
jgi:hypothetical protein